MTHFTNIDMTAHPGNRRRGIGVWGDVRPLSGSQSAVKAISPT
jgi:hypothetical protein